MSTDISHNNAQSGAPTVYSVQAQRTSAGDACIQVGAHSIPIDAAWGATPSGLPGPAELLAAAFAACLLKNLARSEELLMFRYRRADVEVTAHRQDTPPMFTEISYSVRLETDEPQRRIDLLHRNLRNYGTVYNTLAAVCNVHGTVEGEVAAP
ncbi:OsmC family protein [Nocardia sp. NPDC046473]|uniref:OsmC family protein n=1 Tax=Nocardia sp. NPDC046473 TaxID=3155733 RepID=UPI0033C8D0B9